MKRVLVVDDDRRMRRTLQVLVERMGLESAAAADAGEAREQLRRARFDLVLTDLKMPEMSGIVLLRSLDATHDNKAEAARRLGISERTLWYKLKKHGL